MQLGSNAPVSIAPADGLRPKEPLPPSLSAGAAPAAPAPPARAAQQTAAVDAADADADAAPPRLAAGSPGRRKLLREIALVQ